MIKRIGSNLLFLPSVNFSLLAAEIFPWAFIYRILTRSRIYLGELIFIYLVVYGFWLLIFTKYQPGIFDIFRSTLAFANAYLVFELFLKLEKDKVEYLINILKPLIIFLILLGVLQLIGAVNFLDNIKTFIVQRNAPQFVGGGRGVSLLSTEPSRAAINFIFLYLLYRTVFPVNKIRSIATDFLISIFIIFFIKSAVGVLTWMILLLIIYPKLMLASIFLVSFSPLVIESEISRGLSILTTIFSENDFDSVFNLLLSNSGFRVSSVLSSYIHMFNHVPYGSGLGTAAQASIDAHMNSGFQLNQVTFFAEQGKFIAVRPTSYAANVALEIGMIGFMLLFTIVYRVRSLTKYSRYSLSLFILFMVNIFINGSAGNPVPWICSALAVRNISHQISKNQLVD